jgi:hypothetical protein
VAALVSSFEHVGGSVVTSPDERVVVTAFGVALPNFFPVAAHSFAEQLGGHVDPPSGVVVTALIGSLEHVAGTVVVAPDELDVVIAFGVANSELPTFVDVPNICFFSSPSSFVAHFVGVFVGNSMDAPSNDAPYSNLANPRGPLYKKRVYVDSIANLNHNPVSDTIVPPINATTIHYRNRSPRPCRG